jgi:hypothetical protein
MRGSFGQIVTYDQALGSKTPLKVFCVLSRLSNDREFLLRVTCTIANATGLVKNKCRQDWGSTMTDQRNE